MSSNTKIIVLKSKEIIYTCIFIILGILLILLLWYMFSPKQRDAKETVETTEAVITYQPGVYSSLLNIGGSCVELQTTVNEHAVTHIDVVNADETVTAMYPLVQPSVDAINEQLSITGSLEDVTYSSENQYTTVLLLDSAKQAAASAIVSPQ